jgi:hypothetical protein
LAGGEQPVVANLDEVLGEHVEREAANEFVGWDGAASLAAGAKGNEGVADREQARVGEGNAVGIEAEVGDDLRGAAEGLLGVDDPGLTGEAAGEGAEGPGIEAGVPEGAGLEEGDQGVEELAAKEAGERLDGEEIVLVCARPAIGAERRGRRR